MDSPTSLPQSCAVCGDALGRPVFSSPGNWSVTSLCAVTTTPSIVYFCRSCGHVQTPAMADIETYYDTEYKILIESEEEDQLYQLVDGHRIYRLDHQADTLLRKLNPPHGAAILDYGCAKGGTLKRVLARRKDLRIHLFDVSETYIPFWKSFIPQDHWSTYRPNEAWTGRFDAVTSFFALEHVAQPRQVMGEIARLLRPGGTFYGIVPNTFTNTADFVVSDHVHHYSAASLASLMEASGFRILEIDDQAHVSAFVVTALSTGTNQPRSADAAAIAATAADVARIASYWTGFSARARAFERDHAGRAAAVYGSGFYGTFLATCLADLSPIRCFIDQSPFRQGRTLLDRPIRPPEQLPPDVETVYVGLNPIRARDEIAKVAAWTSRRLEYFYP